MDNLAIVRRFTTEFLGRADLAAADATMHPDIRGGRTRIPGTACRDKVYGTAQLIALLRQDGSILVGFELAKVRDSEPGEVFVVRGTRLI